MDIEAAGAGTGSYMAESDGWTDSLMEKGESAPQRERGQLVTLNVGGWGDLLSRTIA